MGLLKGVKERYAIKVFASCSVPDRFFTAVMWVKASREADGCNVDDRSCAPLWQMSWGSANVWRQWFRSPIIKGGRASERRVRVAKGPGVGSTIKLEESEQATERPKSSLSPYMLRLFDFRGALLHQMRIPPGGADSQVEGLPRPCDPRVAATHLAPELLKAIAALGGPSPWPIVRQRQLRPIVDLPAREQRRKIEMSPGE